MEGIAELTAFSFVKTSLLGVPVIVARTGYTGEDGVEIFIPWADTVHIWKALLHTGGARPIGLGARDTLRLEAAYPLHGHELSEDDSAFESGLGWIIKLKKGAFTGSQALESVKAAGIPNRLVGFVLEDAGIARHGDVVVSDSGQPVGVVTSGTKTPTVERAIGLARVPRVLAEVGSPLSISVRGRALRATVVKTPFYSRLVRGKLNA
jgi:aminomethyltransferase